MKCLGGRKKEINCMKEPKFNEALIFKASSVRK